MPLPRIIVFDLDYTLWPFWCDTHISPPLKSIKDNTSTKKAESKAVQTEFVANKMTDRWGESFGFYAEVPGILSAAKDRGIVLGVASRTHTPDIARDLLRGLTVPIYPSSSPSSSVAADGTKSSKQESIKITRAIDFFPSALQQIYPGSKTTHFKRIHSVTLDPKNAATIPGLQQKGRTGIEVPYEDMLFFDDEARNRNVEMELGVTFHLVRDGVTREEVDKGVWAWRKRRGITVRERMGSKGMAEERNSGSLSELEG